jgi:ATP-dependent DNA helicase Rep
MSNPLNPSQREAVRHLDGPCLVLAGAGSGKTRVITAKIAHLLLDRGLAASEVIALTFTNKAAAEMHERVGKLVEKEKSKGLVVSTFHSLGVRILRQEAKSLGMKQRFSILDADDCFGIVQGLAATTDKQTIRRLQNTISLWKNGLVDPETAIASAQTDDALIAARIYRDYDATIRSYQSVDFDDLIALPMKLFREDAEARTRWQSRLKHLLVDEYQDTNACQYELMKLLVGPSGVFTAVGDDDQAIYAWRGATLENLRQLERDYPRLKVIKLEQNYRSSQNILNAANTLIERNPKLYPKKLWSEHGVGDPIRVIAMEDDEAEAENVVMKLLAHKFERRAKLGDYAILYRSNHQARAFEKALRKERIPYVLSGGQSFFDRAEIKDLLAYLRLIVNDDDDPAFIRAITTPRRGVGSGTLEVLGKLAAERHASLFESAYSDHLNVRLQPRQLEPLREFCDFMGRMGSRAQKEAAGPMLDELLKTIGYEAHLFEADDDKTATTRWKNVLDFRNWIAERSERDSKPFAEVAQEVTILSMLDKDESDLDAVRLSTLHAAKGLEYPHVFLVGVEEGLLPHTGRDEDAPADALVARLEEERRLMYVGITRAQRTLHVTWCKRRRRARESVPREPSRFLVEMGLEKQKTDTSAPQITAKDRLADLKAMLNKQKV